MALNAATSNYGSSGNGGGGISFELSSGWNIAFHSLQQHHHQDDHNSNTTCNTEEGIVLASIPLTKLYAHDNNAYRAFVPQIDSKEGTADGKYYTTNEEVKAAAANVALADYTARALSNLLPIHHHHHHDSNNKEVTIQTMGQSKHANGVNQKPSRRRRNKINVKKSKKEVPIPYVLERTDCMVITKKKQGENNQEAAATTALQFFLHIASPTSLENDHVVKQLEGTLSPLLQQLQSQLTSRECYAHVACVVLQRMLRLMLQPPKQSNAMNSIISSNSSDIGGANRNQEEKKMEDSNHTKSINNHSNQQQQYLNAVAFIADKSLLPRKSGRSELPMASPPAIPFHSPEGSEQLTRNVTVEVGCFWRRFLNEDGTVKVDAEAMDTAMIEENEDASSSSTVTMRGMIIPRGVTLIVGGGYHGKSTLLQALTMGVYDNIPFDGRERAVSHSDAVSIRAEDGRYVHNTNVSAFISNLPSGKSINGASVSSKQDTSKFSTKDASGSTSQAANVIEALESGANTLLVDEDVSAANFMARDGRMRAMIMDEPITPLLYRVNGLFLSKEHEVSTVVVVGGVGEWLDVADAVILMKDYVAYDGLQKARSVSYQFSYGHVQYAGRGVVHRLPWEVKEEKKIMKKSNDGEDESMDIAEDEKKPTPTLSPLRRRPDSMCIMNKFKGAAVHLLESGSSRLSFYRDEQDAAAASNEASMDNDDDEDDGMVDMSKSSQLVGNASEQLYGCGICILWLIRESVRRPEEDLTELLDRMESTLNNSSGIGGGGMNELIASLKQSGQTTHNNCSSSNIISELLSSHDVLDLWETVGYAYRPRRHEVAMALTRMRGMRFDILPEKPKEIMLSKEEVKRLEEESKKRALADLWANRRKK